MKVLGFLALSIFRKSETTDAEWEELEDLEAPVDMTPLGFRSDISCHLCNAAVYREALLLDC